MPLVKLPALPAPPLTPEVGGLHIGALRSWGYRIGLAAKDALGASDEINRGVGARDVHVEAIRRHYGLENDHHSLHAETIEWLRLGETQATRGLEHFLSSSGDRARAFLQALAPTLNWPTDLSEISIETEKRAGRGRIDLMIFRHSQGATWGAVIEAKFEHSLKGNPLGDYRRYAANLGMAVDDFAEPTGVMIVLGKRVCRQTRKRLRRNGQWRFVHWREVLRRFDTQLAEQTLDEDFRRFRRTLWERTGI